MLVLGSGRNDGLFFREAHLAAAEGNEARIAELIDLAAAFQPTSEIALETQAQGAAFLRAIRLSWTVPDIVWPDAAAYPIAVALACAVHGIGLEDGLHAYFQAMAANLVSAGVRLIPLGQTDGQTTLARLEGAVATAAEQALVVPLDDLGSAAPIVDLTSMKIGRAHV